MTTIQGATIWLTGASSGIGLALAEQLAAKGAKLILTARSTQTLEALAERLPGEHQVLSLDLSKPEEAVRNAATALGEQKIDILINNAGVSQRSLALDTEFQVYRDLMEINYFSVVALSKWVAPRMVEQGHGCIVSVSSVAGKVATKRRSGYSGAKFAVIGFMDALRAELKASNVHCLTVCPGFVHTQIAHNALVADGSRLGQADPDNAGGISAEQCAQEIVRAIEQRRDEIVVGKGLSKIAPWLQRVAPGLLRNMIAKRD
ncbi:SDR family oxidoreductase [Aliidiomarina maris]|uniref:Short chain dehydrogenase n=1 Tax=Aliidiomarina maris TaxID=531312 RepID=A0A327X4V5_9GAMM|nr:SDR family oxidoreductase [Aliidiomarina maris]RAK01679.1 short-subunit dehydrogenase [Aliidiomarina maris]RUO28501.1 short chain dehydrogenase [Aliidiomarina maris]